MKQLALLVLFFAATVCSAQVELETNEKGDFRVKKNNQGWKSSNISSELKAMEYKEYFSQAILNPGEKILVKQSEKTVKLRPIFRGVKEVNEGFIVYDDSAKIIRYLESKEQKEGLSYLILFGIMAIILMLISNIFELITKKINDGFISNLIIMGSAVSAGTIAISVIAISVNAIIAACLGFAACIAVAVNFVTPHYYDENDYRGHRLMISIYYILMAAYLVFIFL